jgi:hypothetical protein
MYQRKTAHIPADRLDRARRSPRQTVSQRHMRRKSHGPRAPMTVEAAALQRAAQCIMKRMQADDALSSRQHQWPAGPPKLMKPSRSQYQNAVEKGTCATSSFIEVDLLFSLPELLLVFFQFHVAADTV